MPRAKTDHEQDLAAPLIDDACARNAVLELHRRDRDQALPAARGRMLDVHNGELLVATPQIIGKKNRLFRGIEVDAYFSADGKMMTFITRIISIDRKIRLNNKIISGYALTPPVHIRPGQRRSYYRTSLVCEDPIPAELQRVISLEPMQRCEGEPIAGRLIDASPAGLGLIIYGVGLTKLKLYDHFVITFTLPDASEPFWTVAELRQAREIPGMDCIRIGTSMVPWPDQRSHALRTQPLMKYLNSAQLRQRRAA